MLFDICFARFDRANVDVDDLLALTLVDAGHIVSYDRGIHPDEFRQYPERNRVAHEFEPKFLFRDLRKGHVVPGDVGAPQRTGHRLRCAVEDDKAARPQLSDVRLDGFEVEGDQGVDEIGHSVVPALARANDVVCVAAADARGKVLIRVNFQAHSLENAGNQIARGQAAVPGLAAEHDLDIVEGHRASEAGLGTFLQAFPDDMASNSVPI